MTLYRGWIVELEDGTILKEVDTVWKEVPKNKIKCLSLHYDNRRWDLNDKQAYFVLNRASEVPGVANSRRIEIRGIGYYEGSQKVFLSVNEETGKFSIKVLNV